MTGGIMITEEAQAPQFERRELTDDEDRQFREKYPQVWQKCHSRALLMSDDPITLQVRVYDVREKMVLPVEVKGFELNVSTGGNSCQPSHS